MKFLSFLIIGIFAVSTLDGCKLFENPNTTIQSLELQQRGKELHSEIDKKYNEIKSNSTQGPGEGIEKIVIKYIPIGTSFDDAKTILHYAGYDYSIVEKPFEREHIPWNYASSLVVNTALSSPWYIGAKLEINLFPQIPGNFYSPVGKVYAIIRYTAI